MTWMEQATQFASKYSDTIGHAVEGVSTIGTFLQEREAAKQDKKANRAMLQAAEEEAALAKADATQRAESERRNAAFVRSQQIAAYLKSGVTLDGSPMLVGDETISRGAQNAQNIMTNADFQARALRNRAISNQRTISRANLFKTSFETLGSFSKASKAYSDANK